MIYSSRVYKLSAYMIPGCPLKILNKGPYAGVSSYGHLFRNIFHLFRNIFHLFKTFDFIKTIFPCNFSLTSKLAKLKFWSHKMLNFLKRIKNNFTI